MQKYAGKSKLRGLLFLNTNTLNFKIFECYMSGAISGRIKGIARL